MKTIITITSVSLSLVLSSYARNYGVVLSKDLPESELKAHVKDWIKFVNQSTKQGDLVIFIDGSSSPSMIAKFYRSKLTNHPKGRLRAFASGMRKLGTFAMNGKKAPQIGSLNYPRVVEYINQNITNNGVKLDSVYVYGSPIHKENGVKAEKAFNMKKSSGKGGHEYWIPSDSHLKKTRHQSVYGCASLTKTFHNTDVYWVTPRSFSFAFSTLKSQVFRWWSVYSSECNSDLISIGSDKMSAMMGMQFSKKVPQSFKTNYTERFSMKSIRPVQVVPDQVPEDKKEQIPKAKVIKPKTQKRKGEEALNRDEKKVQSIMANKNLKGEDPVAGMNLVGKLKVGIRWKGDIDLDVYTKPNSLARELYYSQTKTKEGKFWKDVTRQSGSKMLWEVVEYNEPVDLSKLSLSVNFFNGDSIGGIEGEVVFFYEPLGGKSKEYVFIKSFSIKAKKGNGGKNQKIRSSDPHWVVLNPLSVIK